MAHAESNRRDGRPGDIVGTDDGAGIDENTALVESSTPDEDRVLDEDAAPGEVIGASTTRAAREADAGAAGAEEHDRFAARWQEIQAEFVDDPRRAVQDADALIAGMMERLARLLASEREHIGSRAGTGDVSTEDLRQGLQRYRSLFERLLAA